MTYPSCHEQVHWFPVSRTATPDLCSSYNASVLWFYLHESLKDIGTLELTLAWRSRFLFQIILHSMHKYQPRVHVIRKDFSSDLSPTKPVPVGDGVKTFNFPETVFTTVTAYQNQQVRGCLWQSPAVSAFKGACSGFREEMLTRGTEDLEWETASLQCTRGAGDDKAVMPRGSWHSLDLDQRDLCPGGPVLLSHFHVSLRAYPCS